MSDQHFHVRPPNSELIERANWLRDAVRAAGGNQAVSKRSGVPLRNLTRYLAGEEMKASALVALAAGCDVTAGWLANGEVTPVGYQVPNEKPPPPAGLFSLVDVDRFAAALDGASDLFRRLNRRPDTVRLVQVALLIYDAVGEAQPSDEAILAAINAPK